MTLRTYLRPLILIQMSNSYDLRWLSSIQVMMEWERPLMEAHADVMCMTNMDAFGDLLAPLQLPTVAPPSSTEGAADAMSDEITGPLTHYSRR